MILDYLQIVMLAVGLAFFLVGLLVLFSENFYNWLNSGVWKKGKSTLFVGLFSKKDEHFVNKYVTSVQSILIGLTLLLFVFFTL